MDLVARLLFFAGVGVNAPKSVVMKEDEMRRVFDGFDCPRCRVGDGGSRIDLPTTNVG
jgi:hypothetical protein